MSNLRSGGRASSWGSVRPRICKRGLEAELPDLLCALDWEADWECWERELCTRDKRTEPDEEYAWCRKEAVLSIMIIADNEAKSHLANKGKHALCLDGAAERKGESRPADEVRCRSAPGRWGHAAVSVCGRGLVLEEDWRERWGGTRTTKGSCSSCWSRMASCVERSGGDDRRWIGSSRAGGGGDGARRGAIWGACAFCSLMRSAQTLTCGAFTAGGAAGAAWAGCCCCWVGREEEDVLAFLARSA